MKGILLLVMAVIAGLAAAVFTQMHLKKQKGTVKEVYQAIEDVSVGEVIGKRAVRVAVPSAMFPNLFDEAPTASLNGFVRNTPVKRPIKKGDIVLYRHLDTSVDPEIRRSIPFGERAITLSVSEQVAVAFFIEPGDVVDVLATLSDPASGEIVNKPLLKAVKVLAVGDRYWRGDYLRSARESYSTVTLLVSVEEAQKLALAKTVLAGELTFLMRNPEDLERSQTVSPLSVNSSDFDRIGNR